MTNLSALPPEVFAALSEPSGCSGVVATIDPDGGPHLAPFGSLYAPSPERLRFGCDRRHSTFENLRRDDRVAVSLVTPPDIAITVFGRATVVRESMTEIPTDAVVEIAIEEVKDDMPAGTAIESGVRYTVPEGAYDYLERYMADVRRS